MVGVVWGVAGGGGRGGGGGGGRLGEREGRLINPFKSDFPYLSA